jgi:hypothetical protein
MRGLLKAAVLLAPALVLAVDEPAEDDILNPKIVGKHIAILRNYQLISNSRLSRCPGPR